MNFVFISILSVPAYAGSDESSLTRADVVQLRQDTQFACDGTEDDICQQLRRRLNEAYAELFEAAGAQIDNSSSSNEESEEAINITINLPKKEHRAASSAPQAQLPPLDYAAVTQVRDQAIAVMECWANKPGGSPFDREIKNANPDGSGLHLGISYEGVRVRIRDWRGRDQHATVVEPMPETSTLGPKQSCQFQPPPGMTDGSIQAIVYCSAEMDGRNAYLRQTDNRVSDKLWRCGRSNTYSLTKPGINFGPGGSGSTVKATEGYWGI